MLRQLKEDGFISSGSGRSSVVIKDFSNEDHADFCRTYYLAHKDAALELQCLRRSFLSSILFPAFCRLPADRREQLSQYLSKVRRWEFRAFIDFFCIVLDSLGNPLLPSLFAESTMFGHLSDLYMMTDASYSDFYFDRLANYMENLLTSHAAEDFDGIKRQLDQISQLRAEKLRKNLEASYAGSGQSDLVPVPFHGTSPRAESSTDPLPHRFSFTESYAVSTSLGSSCRLSRSWRRNFPWRRSPYAGVLRCWSVLTRSKH